jgi:hypothetical protein
VMHLFPASLAKGKWTAMHLFPASLAEVKRTVIGPLSIMHLPLDLQQEGVDLRLGQLCGRHQSKVPPVCHMWVWVCVMCACRLHGVRYSYGMHVCRISL